MTQNDTNDQETGIEDAYAALFRLAGIIDEDEAEEMKAAIREHREGGIARDEVR